MKTVEFLAILDIATESSSCWRDAVSPSVATKIAMRSKVVSEAKSDFFIILLGVF
jgi:hypothetical protein